MNEISQEDWARLIALGGDNSNLEAAIKQQLAQAEALAPTPPQMKNAGRVVIAPNVLELLGGLAQRKAQQNLLDQAQAGRTKQTANTNLQNQMIMQAILSGQPTAPSSSPVGGNGFLPPKPQGPFSLGGQ